MNLGLDGKTALVTGATTGIGEGIARSLAAEGVRVVIAGRRPDALEGVAHAIATAGGQRPTIVIGDLRDTAATEDIARQALAACDGRVDILVNNAGASRPLKTADDDSAWEEALALNFASARRLTFALIEPMRAAKWGRVVNLTGAMVAPSWNASGAAKSALNSWSRTLAIQLAPDNITVNAIAPGRINSEQIRTNLHPTADSRDAFIRQFIPMGRFGDPEDIANLVTFLASPRAGYISGAAIPVDGAMLRIS
jgi:3-oxoacyl-[acyl-carrier protein] reductase